MNKISITINGKPIMSAFARMDLKEYFEVLEKLTGDKKYSQMYEDLRKYTVLLDGCEYDPSNDSLPRRDVTVGEMLFAAHNAIFKAESYFPDDEFGDCVDETFDPDALREMGRTVIRSILVDPLSDERLEKLSKGESI